MEPRKFTKKLKVWFSEYWNINDFMGILLFLVGVSLRWHQETRLASHIVYSLDFIFWSVRLLDLFAVNQHAGPYLTMITKMVCNLNVSMHNFSLHATFAVVMFFIRAVVF